MLTFVASTSKKVLKISLLLCISLSLVNCSKKDDPIAEQDPLSGYLKAAGFDQKVTNYVNSADYEFGYSFIPLVDGKITAIVAKIPAVQNGVRVTIWDKTAGTVLRTESIDFATADVEVVKPINALALTKDKEYFITFNSNDWYEHKKTDGTNATYPFTVGDIKITGYSYKSGTTQTLPNVNPTNYYAGDCSFRFQK
jgi:hypothetical protein